MYRNERERAYVCMYVCVCVRENKTPAQDWAKVKRNKNEENESFVVIFVF